MLPNISNFTNYKSLPTCYALYSLKMKRGPSCMTFFFCHSFYEILNVKEKTKQLKKQKRSNYVNLNYIDSFFLLHIVYFTHRH